ncbi:major facilitator superfamily domain-containing protein [Annulohypoxylon nitens]|nr:major facilitator superfamily domain-containing protein [Annulohypoxylon nitens]
MQSDETMDKAEDDVAAQFMLTLDSSILGVPIEVDEARRVLWKIDLIVLPLIAGTVILSAVDKVIISNAAILGMKGDLNLVGDQYSWAGSIFYFGYLAFEWPTAILIQRLPVAKLLSFLTFCWAVMLFCTAATQNFAGLAATRFIMGCTEAGTFPIASILTVMWYTNTEQPIRVAIWFNQFSSIFSGIVSYGIAQSHTSIAQWRLLFVVLGAFSILWSLLLLVVLPDSPVTAGFLSKRERYICVRRVQVNNTGIEEKRIKWYQVKECMLDPKTWLLAIFACAQNVPNGGLVTFSAIIVSGLGYTPTITTLLGMPTGIIATIWQVLLAVPCGRYKNKRCAIIAVSNIIPMICAILMWKLPRDNEHGLLAAYYVFYTYWGPCVMCTSVHMANVSGHTKKITMNAVFFVAYCVGNIIGPQVFRASDAPDYSHGYIGLLACFVVSSISISMYGVLCRWDNAEQDKIAADVFLDQDPILNEFSDKTDREKPEFRYIY